VPEWGSRTVVGDGLALNVDAALELFQESLVVVWAHGLCYMQGPSDGGFGVVYDQVPPRGVCRYLFGLVFEGLQGACHQVQIVRICYRARLLLVLHMHALC